MAFNRSTWLDSDALSGGSKDSFWITDSGTTMKLLTISAGLLIVALAGFGLATTSLAQDRYLFWGILALGFYLALRSAFVKAAPTVSSAKPDQAPAAEAPVPTPVAASAPANLREAAVIHFLGALQEKGRLVDFLMDDITRYEDAQVGAAARVVHAGCKAALQEHLSVEPVAAEAEGSTVTVPPERAADAYRLVGQVAGTPPFTGTLVHPGWKAVKVKLPRVMSSEGTQLPVIAPAQVELK
jgi:hypothetical protein